MFLWERASPDLFSVELLHLRVYCPSGYPPNQSTRIPPALLFLTIPLTKCPKGNLPRIVFIVGKWWFRRREGIPLWGENNTRVDRFPWQLICRQISFPSDVARVVCTGMFWTSIVDKKNKSRHSFDEAINNFFCLGLTGHNSNRQRKREFCSQIQLLKHQNKTDHSEFSWCSKFQAKNKQHFLTQNSCVKQRFMNFQGNPDPNLMSNVSVAHLP